MELLMPDKDLKTSNAALDGFFIPADLKVQVFLAAANRDLRFRKDPNAYDTHRSTMRHMAFNSSLHTCIRQTIVRLEGEALLKALVRRVNTIELCATPVRRLNNYRSSFKFKPLRVTTL